MCRLFAIDSDTGDTVLVAGTGMHGAADGPSYSATLSPLWGPGESMCLVASETCVYVATGSGVRRITLNSKYFEPPKSKS